MHVRSRFPRIMMLLFLGGLVPGALHGQSLKDRMKAKAKERADARADAGMDKGLDKFENAVKCVAGNDECVENAKSNGKKVVLTDDSGAVLPADQQPEDSPAHNASANSASSSSSSGGSASAGGSASSAGGAAENAKPGQGAWANYDFIPGEKVLFADDFKNDRVGNFPQRLEFIAGNMEIVDDKGTRWLRATSPGKFMVTLPEALPARFTIEFDLALPWNGMIVYAGPDGSSADPNFDLEAHQHSFVYLSGTDAGVKNAGGQGGSTVDPRPVTHVDDINGHLFKVRIAGDGKYLKVYLDEHRIANIPNSNFMRSNKIYFEMSEGGDGASDTSPSMIGNISINAGGRDMYDALSSDGRVVTQGIYFDVGSDRIRPESTPTLKLISDMLTQHADLKLTIEGHTDSTGDAAANQSLSQRRAQAIVAWLTSSGGVGAGRLTAKGMGSTKPAAPNTTPEGRQQNRRVELVKVSA